MMNYEENQVLEHPLEHEIIGQLKQELLNNMDQILLFMQAEKIKQLLPI